MKVLYVSAPNIPIGEDRTDALYRAAYRDLPQASLERVGNSYHFIMLDQPERFASELREFLGWEDPPSSTAEIQPLPR